jgi:hypothetical protein
MSQMALCRVFCATPPLSAAPGASPESVSAASSCGVTACTRGWLIRRCKRSLRSGGPDSATTCPDAADASVSPSPSAASSCERSVSTSSSLFSLRDAAWSSTRCCGSLSATRRFRSAGISSSISGRRSSKFNSSPPPPAAAAAAADTLRVAMKTCTGGADGGVTASRLERSPSVTNVMRSPCASRYCSCDAVTSAEWLGATESARNARNALASRRCACGT